jgi:hypothetical protein
MTVWEVAKDSGMFPHSCHAMLAEDLVRDALDLSRPLTGSEI